MPNYFVNLPGAQVPRNALVDFAPVNNALESMRQQNNTNRLFDAQQEERQYQRGRDAKQDARVAKADARSEVEWYGKAAAAVDRLQGPQRAQAWQNVLRKHGGQGLSAEELDPTTGPKLLMAEAGQWRDPREDEAANLDLQYKRAQIAQLNQRADQSRVVEVGGNLVRVPQSGPAEEIYSGKPKMTPAETALDKTYGKSYEEDIVSGGLADAEKNLSQLKAVRDQLINPRGPNLTGPLLGRLPDAVAAFTNPKAVDARERVEEVVQRNLRVILGAQFTNEEGKRLIARAYNPALDEATNASRLGNLIGAMEAAISAKKAAADYFERNGTLKGYQGRTNFSVSDLEASLDGGSGAAALKAKYGLE